MLQPPNVNGIMALSDIEKADIKTKLEEIQSRPMSTDEYGDDIPWNLFWTVAFYNRENVGNEINGDTAQMILEEVV
jgi:hypothetical protein